MTAIGSTILPIKILGLMLVVIKYRLNVPRPSPEVDKEGQISEKPDNYKTICGCLILQPKTKEIFPESLIFKFFYFNLTCKLIKS